MTLVDRPAVALPWRSALLPLLLAWPLLLFPPGAEPATRSGTAKSRAASAEAFYRCRDAQGQTHFGQSIPAECMNLDVEVLDRSGRVVRVIAGAASMQRRVQEQADEQAEALRRTTAAQRDRTLLATYLSVADIERLRDQRLELLQQQSLVTRQYIENLRERQQRLMSDVTRFRPYSDDPDAPALPAHVGEDIVSTVNGLQVYEQQLAGNTIEQQRLREEFDGDIARFKELKGLK